jgi:hypothetical protein
MSDHIHHRILFDRCNHNCTWQGVVMAFHPDMGDCEEAHDVLFVSPSYEDIAAAYVAVIQWLIDHRVSDEFAASFLELGKWRMN